MDLETEINLVNENTEKINNLETKLGFKDLNNSEMTDIIMNYVTNVKGSITQRYEAEGRPMYDSQAQIITILNGLYSLKEIYSKKDYMRHLEAILQ